MLLLTGPGLHLSTVCGRGGGSNNHPGNEAFRVLVNDVKLIYVNCPKREKPLIARRVVEAVRNQSPPGRFLQKENETGLWNDIGDGRAREKTSQALREGAPVIRNMIDKQPSSVEPCSESKKQRKLDSPLVVLESKETAKRHVKDTCDSVRSKETQMYQEYANQLSSQAMKERVCPLPPSNMPSNMHQPRYDSDYCPPRMPQFQSNFQNTLPVYPRHPSNEETGRYTGGFALPPPMQFSQHRRRATMDFAPSHVRHAAPDTVPYETVRGLLLGHLDPVQLAYSILPPEDAAAVARLHMNNDSFGTKSNADQKQYQQSFDQQPAGSASNCASKPLPLVAVVSDGSSSPSECQSIKEENQSSDESSRQSSVKTRSVLPKKKRKFIE